MRRKTAKPRRATLHRRATALAVATLAMLAGCVYPRPPAGEPVPGLVLTLSQPNPVREQVVVTATAVNYVPRSVTFRLGANGPVLGVDDAAPFEATFDTTTVTDGPYAIFATGADDRYTVSEKIAVVVQNRPNVVVVMLDDLDVTVTPYWDAMPRTRELLADRGLTFTNALTPDPVCCPARATFLTGRYPHNTGVFDITGPDGGWAPFRAQEPDTLATRLTATGYRTAFFGKYLQGYTSAAYVPPGWNEWFAFTKSWYDGYSFYVSHNGTRVEYGTEADDYQTDVVTDRVTAFLSSTEANDGQPFFALVAPSAPHWPLPPAPRHTNHAFASVPLPASRANFDEADVSDKPTWLQALPQLSPSHMIFATGDYRDRLGSLLAVDDMVARLVDALSQQNELDRTVIVFTSDNGYNLGAHRLLAKQAPYEESIRVPLVVTGPGVRVGADTSLVTLADLAPTILELAGVDGSDLDGVSLAALFSEPVDLQRADVVIEFNGTYNWIDRFHTYDEVTASIAAGRGPLVPTYRAVRNNEWLYVRWYAGDVHEYELYDLDADPFQLENLLSAAEVAPEHVSMAAALQQRLDELLACTGATCH